MKKKLLIYAHYYIPDTASTGQILAELAEGLQDQFDVTVICVIPSYGGKIEDKYKTKNYYFEKIRGVNIIRVRVPDFSKTNKMSRIKNIAAYFFRAMGVTKKIGRQDYVLAVSQPPVLGGLLGVYGKWKLKKAKLIYQIQDFNPEQIIAVGYLKSRPLLWLLGKLDDFSCKQADLVITVGRDLVETVEKRFRKNLKHMPKVVLINNWIDEKEIYPLEVKHPRLVKFKEKYGLTDKFVICYSGNLGHYYDLMNLLKVVEKFKPDTVTPPSEKYLNGREVIFAFIGAGSLLDFMKQYVADHNMTNVIFIPYQEKEDLIYSLNAGDIHWCVNAKGIKGVSCPSKYYGIAGVGKPVLGVLEKGSEIRCIIEETNGGLVCTPGEYQKVEENLRWFIRHAGTIEMAKMGKRSREYLLNNLTREKSISKYAEEILKL
ncbi:glycosyltransferase family 4 protein [Lacrimispora amygdalina]|uniref:glycosyltransferase family 4 protein n=1 Tax=Lacrimispora amygdalina TaxID=253257 RepID=UPI000BE3350A|nr:glycosyltransferase family 4 protein [Lacrimispora amygdalina]